MNTANIIGVTRPLSGLGVDEFIAYLARVSNPSNQNNKLTAPKLLKYLIQNKHWSPFEMVHVTMEINTTRDIARQILRHRSFSFQEFSQRYADRKKYIGGLLKMELQKNRLVQFCQKVLLCLVFIWLALLEVGFTTASYAWVTVRRKSTGR